VIIIIKEQIKVT